MMATTTQRIEALEQRVILLQQIAEKQSELLRMLVEHLKK